MTNSNLKKEREGEREIVRSSEYKGPYKRKGKVACS